MPAPKVTDLLNHALELSEREREELLYEESSRNPSTVSEVRDLLKFHIDAVEDEDDFLESGVGKPAAQILQLVPAPLNLGPGQRIGDFTILRKLGSGTFGEVFLARQNSLGREVAIKLSPNTGTEAKMLAPLEHEGIVKVFSETILEEHGLRLLCMQYVPSCNLEYAMKRTPRLNGRRLLTAIENTCTEAELSIIADSLEDMDEVQVAAWLGGKLADALAHAHRKGILHLDIKPANVLLTPSGRPMLVDFNVSQSNQNDHRNSRGGTPRYMSPEQQQLFTDPEGVKLDARADIYALGIVLRDLLSGIKSRKKSYSEECLGDVIQKCCSTDLELRPKSAEKVSQMLLTCFQLRSIERSLPSTPALSPLIFLMMFMGSLSVPFLASLGVAVHYYSQMQNVPVLAHRIAFSMPSLLLFCQLVFSAVSICKWLVHPDLTQRRKTLANLPVTFLIDGLLLVVLGNIFFFSIFELRLAQIGTPVFFSFQTGHILCVGIAFNVAALFIQRSFYRSLYFRLWRMGETPLAAGHLELSECARRLRLTYLVASITTLGLGVILIMVTPTMTPLAARLLVILGGTIAPSGFLSGRILAGVLKAFQPAEASSNLNTL